MISTWAAGASAWYARFYDDLVCRGNVVTYLDYADRECWSLHGARSGQVVAGLFETPIIELYYHECSVRADNLDPKKGCQEVTEFSNFRGLE